MSEHCAAGVQQGPGAVHSAARWGRRCHDRYIVLHSDAFVHTAVRRLLSPCTALSLTLTQHRHACRAFLIWLCTVAAFVYAAVALLAAIGLAKFARVTFGALFWVIALVPLGCFGSWHLWYKRFYWAMVTDGAFSFCMFFTFFMIHIGWCGFAAIAPNVSGRFEESGAGGYTTGFLTAMVFFDVARAAEGSEYEARTRLAGALCASGKAPRSMHATLREAACANLSVGALSCVQVRLHTAHAPCERVHQALQQMAVSRARAWPSGIPSAPSILHDDS